MTPTFILDRPVRAMLAPIERRIGIGTAARLYALTDQGLTGLANIIAFALLGRVLTVEQFGAIGSTIGLQYFVAGFHRSAVVLPFTTDHGAAGREHGAHREDSGWWWLGLMLTGILAALTALAGLGVALVGHAWPSWSWMAMPLLLAALLSPTMLLWEFARRWLYKVERPDMVSLCAAVYFLLLVAGAWGASRAWPSAGGAALAWVAASLGALALALPALRPGGWDRRVAAALVRANRADAGWLAATHLPYSVYSSASVVVLVGILVGPLAAGLFSAARTLTNPAISIVSAIDSIDKPRAARAFAVEGMSGLARVVRRSRLFIALATGLYLGLACLFATPLIQLAFRGHYAGLEPEVRLLSLGFFLFGLSLPSETMLIVLRAGRTMLAIRTATALATLAALALGARHGMSGMVIAFAIAQGLGFVLLRLGERGVGGADGAGLGLSATASSAAPHYSIVVLTFAREPVLAEMLDRLAGYLAGREDYELILVDNNPERIDRAGSLARFHAARTLWDGTNKGVAARNLGFDAARGDVVVLLDDDVFVETPDFLDRFGARFVAEPRLGVVTVAKRVRGETRARPDLIPHTDKRVDLSRPFATFRFVGGCVGFRRQALRESGGFLPDFFYGLEEIELSYRLIDCGWTILYDPAIVCEELEHPAGRRPKRLVQSERLTNKFIISFLRMPAPHVWLNLIAFPPYAYAFASGEMDVPLAVRQFVRWLRRPDRLRRRPIGMPARRYIKACGGHLWR